MGIITRWCIPNSKIEFELILTQNSACVENTRTRTPESVTNKFVNDLCWILSKRFDVRRQCWFVLLGSTTARAQKWFCRDAKLCHQFRPITWKFNLTTLMRRWFEIIDYLISTRMSYGWPCSLSKKITRRSINLVRYKYFFFEILYLNLVLIILVFCDSITRRSIVWIIQTMQCQICRFSLYHGLLLDILEWTYWIIINQ